MKLGDAFVDDFIKRVFSVCMMGSVHDTDSKRDQRLVEHLKVKILCGKISPTGALESNVLVAIPKTYSVCAMLVGL